MKKIMRNISVIILLSIVTLTAIVIFSKQDESMKIAKINSIQAKQVTTGVGSESKLSKFSYVKDDVNKTVTLKHYTNSEIKADDVTIYSKYEINGNTYSTIIEKEGTESFFTGSVEGVRFQDGIIWRGNAEYFFKDCTALTSVYFGGVHYTDSSNASFKGMFSGCEKLAVVYFEEANFDIVTDISYMFYNCKALSQYTNFGSFTAANVTNMEQLFYGCSSLTNINIGNWNTSNVTNMSGMFYNCKTINGIDLSRWNTLRVTDMSNMFIGCSSLTNINIGNWNTSNVTDMSSMFANCDSLQTINIENWNTSKVENMSFMFSDCIKLSNIDVSKWKTSALSRAEGMFQSTKITSIDLNNWDTSNLRWTAWMFDDCTRLQTINIENWNTSNVTNMSSMFDGCSSLENIDVSRWDTSKVQVGCLDNMFRNCSKIVRLDISNFDLKTTCYNADMFQGCNFDILVTPKSISDIGEFPLPYVMYTEDGREHYTNLPSTSMTLYKTPTMKYIVTFRDGNTILKEEKVTLGASATAPTAPTKVGYTFAGWDKDFTNVTSDLEVNAIWTPNLNTAYKVEYYKQNTTLNGYELVDTDNLVGTTGESVIAVAKTYIGYTENQIHEDRIATGEIKADGSLVLKLYYDRNTYRVTLHTNGGTIKEVEQLTSYVYGVGATLPTPLKQGHTFAGWYKTEDLTGDAIDTIGTGAAGDKEYFAKWTTNTDTVYMVEYYKQNTSLDNYELVNTEERIGTTGTTIGVVGGTYTGFTYNEAKSISTGEIKADGSLVLELYYDRNTYKVTLDADGGIIKEGENVTSYVYGVGATLPIPTKQGYTFAGWYEQNPLVPSQPVTAIGIYGAGDKVYLAKWEVGEATEYKVEHYKQNLETNTYDKVETEEFVGKTGMDVIARPKTYEGFHENTVHQDRVSTGEIKADGSLVLKLYYDVNQYTVTFKDGDQVVKTETVPYGKGATSPTLTKEGYTLSWDKDFSNITSNLEVKAIWIANTNTVYKVEHYKQNTSLNGYDLEETQELAGTTGTRVTAVAKTYQGYTENQTHEDRIIVGEIKADGSLVLKLYYDVNQYTVTFKDGNTVLKTQTVAYGNAATAPTAPTKVGYTFAGWDKDFSNVTSNLEVNAKWIEGTGIVYKVEHYKQNTSLNGYDLEETQELAGITGTRVTAVAKTYQGYTENQTHEDRIIAGEIKADGSLVLKVYYDRNTYKVTLHPNDGTIKDGENVTEYVYGVGVTLPTPTKVGYTFAGWYKTEDLTGDAINIIGVNALGDKEYYAKWIQNQYTVTFKNGDTVLKTETVAHGSAATAPTLTKEGYILSWDKDFSKVISDLEVKAVWSKDPNYIDPNDGKEEKPNKLPQTGESYIAIGTMALLISAGAFLYLKYNKIDKI